jgi:hypothetical protein
MEFRPMPTVKLTIHVSGSIGEEVWHIAGFSSILTGLNFIVTTHRMRAPGMTWTRLPLFVWSNYANAVIMMLGTPVLAITLVLVALERGLHLGIFDPRVGGDPLLFQHLFWFYSHPAVYIMILPGMGVISELVTCFSRKRIFGSIHRSSRCFMFFRRRGPASWELAICFPWSISFGRCATGNWRETIRGAQRDWSGQRLRRRPRTILRSRRWSPKKPTITNR